ncbi:polysaccharide deacetylase family protein [Salinimonas marina]|uniref:Polysaccharide deacetylase family protein n=1 Tax=Salinimonas marina TaxID=2785918 RepID=A0A7S9DX65_9ALTE|nr:polysaccharide deacetylase family protein [Salinimonas marina]QPG05606.1 polysaccharide deacetylase family protein [Salinimonas marina]
MRILVSSWLLLASLAAVGETNSPVVHSAPILLYHHVANDTPASTSISPAQFEQHMAYINKHHTVLPLTEVVAAIKEGEPLPANALAITFDDGYKNILTNGHPILSRYDFPYTIFINPAEIGQRADQLSWQEVKQMQQEGVLFANHTLDHLHMLNKNKDESDAAWLERVWNNVTDAQAMLEEKLGTSITYLAYPFGEYNQALEERLEQQGYVGFGQHSGAAGAASPLTALPRFPAAGPYASLNSLKTKMASLALPVAQTSHPQPQRSAKAPGTITLTIDSEDVRLSQAACYFNGNQINTRTDAQQLSFTLDKKLPTGRSRVNCTAPSKQFNGRYYWYSQPFFVANEAGQYPD